MSKQHILEVATVASQSTERLFELLLEVGRSDFESEIQDIAADLKARKASVRAILDFDHDATLSFKFYLVRPDTEPEMIIDATPQHKTQG